MSALYDCPTCVGTGSMESSDSTEDGWWDCRRCDGTGKLEDRRRPDPRLRRAVHALAELVRLKDGPRDDAYRAAKDAAWDAARAALPREGRQA